MSTKLRVLALPGYTQNASIMSKKMGAVRKACKDVDFIFLDPPHILTKVDFGTSSSSVNSLAAFGSENVEEDESKRTPETTPRAWWEANSDRTKYLKYDETVAYLHEFMTTNEPFDGVIGFSQGGCMASALAALLEKPDIHPKFPSHPALKPFKFAIFVGGFLPASQEPSFEPYFPLALPTLHVIGKTDTLVTEERSMTLVQGSKNARIERHEGGHFIPSKASWRHFFNAYITSFSEGDGRNGDIPPPSAFGPSGSNTPATVPGTREPSPHL